MWHIKYSSCQNCKSINSLYKARGYCIKCYPIVLRLEKTEKWKYNNPNTLKSFPKGFSFPDEKRFVKIKKGIIQQLKERLDLFRMREQRLKDDIYGIDIEYGFDRIAKYCGVRETSLFRSSANTFDHNFTMKQKKIIFEFIDRIEQKLNWKGIDWYRMFWENY